MPLHALSFLAIPTGMQINPSSTCWSNPIVIGKPKSYPKPMESVATPGCRLKPHVFVGETDDSPVDQKGVRTVRNNHIIPSTNIKHRPNGHKWNKYVVSSPTFYHGFDWESLICMYIYIYLVTFPFICPWYLSVNHHQSPWYNHCWIPQFLICTKGYSTSTPFYSCISCQFYYLHLIPLCLLIPQSSPYFYRWWLNIRIKTIPWKMGSLWHCFNMF